MRRLRLLALAPLAVLAACTPPDAALRVNVTVRTVGTSKVRADCLKLSVSDETQALKSIVIPLVAGKDQYVFAVLRGSDLPQSVRLQASGYLGTCTDEASLKLNAQGEVVSAVFPEKGVTEFGVNLDPPGSSLDSDRDGFVAASKGGIDCRDDDGSIFPGAGQICANTDDTDCDGLGGCDDDQCGTAAVCANPPDRVSLTTAVTTMLRYECVGPFTVQLRNASGPRTAVRDTAVSLTSSLPGVSVHGVATCNDTPLTTQTIPYGQTSFEVYLKADAQAFGVTTLTARGDRVSAPGTVSVTVRPQPVASLAFTSPPRTVSAGQCSAEPVTLEFRDAQNRRTDVDAPNQVTLSSSPGDLGNANIFFSDAACTVEAPVAMLQPGQGEVTAYVRARRAGAFTLTATPSIQQPTTQALTVTPATAAQLAFTNAPLVLNTTQSCSAGALTLQLQDEFANPVTATTPVPVRVSVSDLTSVSLYDGAQPNCMTAPATDFSIPAGRDSISLRASGTVASATPGRVTASVTNGASITQAAQDLFVSAGFASRFVLQGSPSSPLASVCSANPVTIELRDSANNPASSASDVVFTLSAPPLGMDASFQFFSGAGCQQALLPANAPTVRIPAGQTSGQFYFRGNKAQQAFEIRAASTLTPPATGVTGNSIRPAAPGKLVTTGAATQTAQAGSCTANPYTAEVRDLYDNVTSFPGTQTVSVASSPAGATVGPAGACTADSVTLAAGSSQVSFTASATTTTSYTLVATVGGFSNSPGVTLTVTPGPSTLQVDVPSMGNANVTAGGCQQVTLTRRDGFGNNAPTAGATPVSLSTPPGTSWLFYTSTNCSGTPVTAVSMNSTATVTFSASPRTSGTHAVTAAIGAGATLQQATINFQVAPGLPSLFFEAPATGTGTASAAQTAGDCTLITVARKDPFNNDVPLGGAGGALTFTLPAGTTAHTGTPCVTGAGGNATTSMALGANDARASFYVRATTSDVNGGPAIQTVQAILASQTATLTLTVNPGAPTLSTVLPAGAAATVSANTCVPVTIERRDGLTNLVPLTGTNLSVSVAPQPAGLSIFSSTDCSGTAVTAVPFTSGQSRRLFSVRHTAATSAPLALTLGLGGQTTGLTLNVTPGTATVLELNGLTATAIAGSCIGPLTVRRRDAWGNAVIAGAATVAMTSASNRYRFSAAAGCGGGTDSLNVNIADGQSVSAEFYASATLVGAQPMTATSGTATGGGSVTIQPETATASLRIPTPAGGSTTVAAGTCVPVTVERRDQYDNLVPMAAAGSITVAPALSLYTVAGCGTTVASVPIAQNQSSVSFFVRSTVAAAPTGYTFTLGALTAVLTLGIDPAATSQIALLGVPASMIAGGCIGPLTVRRRDQFNNDVTAGLASVTLASAVFQFSSAADCAGATTGLSVGIASGQSQSSQFYATGTQAGAAQQLTATLGAFMATGTLVVNPSLGTQLVFTTPVRTFTAGACSGDAPGLPITVQLRDTHGNVAPAGVGGVVFTAASTGVSGQWFSNATCATSAGSFTIAEGASSVSLYYRDTKAGPISVSLGSGLSNPAAQAHTVQPGPARRLVFTTDPRSFTAAQCPGAAGVITVQLQDDFANPVNAPVGGQAFVAQSNTTGTASWFSNDTCGTVANGGNFSIPAGSNSVAVYYQDNRVGTPTVTLGNSSGLQNPSQQHAVVAGPAAQLGFTSTAQSVAALACSGATVVTLQDAGGNAVPNASSRTITFAGPGPANVTFYSDATCATALSGAQTTMASGSNTVTVYFKSEGLGTVGLNASAPGLNPAAQNQTITPAPATKLVVTSATATVEAGRCHPVVVERQDALNRATAPTGATTVTPSASPSSGVAFFTTSACSGTPATTVDIASGASSATVYVKAINGSVTGVVPGSQLYTVTMSSSLGTNPTYDFTLLPMVRRRASACQLSGAASVVCAVTPTLTDINRTILFFQATAGSGDTASDDNATCRLRLNAGNTAEVFCERVGNAGGASVVDIEWQTMSFAYDAANGGVSVQHFTAGCTAGQTNAMPLVVNLPTALTNATNANSFLLFSHRSTGTDNDGSHFFTGRISSNTQATFGQSAGGTTCTVGVDFAAQVVTWAGATVTRGTLNPTADRTLTSFTVNQATATPARTFLLHSSRMTGDTTANAICRRRFRGEITNATTLTFTRGCNGADLQDIRYEHVLLPAGSAVSTHGGDTANNGVSANLSFGGVDLSRTVLFLGGQGPGGSAGGTTDHNSQDRVGTAQARAVFTGLTSAELTRTASNSIGSFTAYLLQVTP